MTASDDAEMRLLWVLATATAITMSTFAGCMMAGCKGGIDVKKAAIDVAGHQAMLDKCKGEARDAGKVSVFDACVKDAGAQ